MKPRLATWWEDVRSSYWFVPGLMALGALAAGFLLPGLDRLVVEEVDPTDSWLYAGSAEGARLLLSTIASSMITVAGVVFSVTIVALALTSNQFGPRLLRNFMRDTGNQVVLGTFVSTFLYCLLVLRAVIGENGPDSQFVPQISVTVAVAWAIASLGVLIYFIHHVAASVQAPNLIARVGDDLRDAVQALFPREIGRPALHREEVGAQLPDFDAEAAWVRAGRSGYVQRIDGDRLLSLAVAHDLVLRLDKRPGDFVVEDEPIVRAWPAIRVDDALTDGIQQLFSVSSQRSLAQDVEFAIEQLVQVALRALSPSLNDPFTAMECVDRLSEGLALLAGRTFPMPWRTDDDGHLRVIASTPDFADLLDTAFEPIRLSARHAPVVSAHLLRGLGRVALHARTDDERRTLRAFADRIHHEAVAEDELEQRRVTGAFHDVLAALGA